MAYDFKNEDDVKDYIKNLGTEYRFGCFSEKNPEGKYPDNVLVFTYLKVKVKSYVSITTMVFFF